MRLERPIPIPNPWPMVPPRVGEKLTSYLERTFRIDLFVADGKRWEKFNAIHLDDGPPMAEVGPAEIAAVGKVIKACANAHALEVGRGGKYCAVLLRWLGETDRHRATFKVEPELAEVEPEGVFDKATAVKMIMSFDAPKFTQSDFKESKIDADATLLTYKIAGMERGKQVEMYHSTIWTNRGGQAAFHQGTYAAKQ